MGFCWGDLAGEASALPLFRFWMMPNGGLPFVPKLFGFNLDFRDLFQLEFGKYHVQLPSRSLLHRRGNYV